MSGNADRQAAAEKAMQVASASGQAAAPPEARLAQSVTGMDTARMAQLGLLTSEFAHEISNIIATINGYATMLLQDTPAADPRRGHLEIVQSEARRARRALDTMTQLARGGKGTVRVPVDIDRLLDDVLALVSPEADACRIEVKRARGEGCRVLGCEDELKQVFHNLLVNAVHAIGAGGTISVAAELSGDGTQVLARVADTGCGIPAGELDRIFEAFHTTRGQSGGTGLGLFVSRDIVLRHGGEVLVQSTPGKGTAFTVVLPAESGGGG